LALDALKLDFHRGRTAAEAELRFAQVLRTAEIDRMSRS
jgi:hypothetical protein